MLLYWIADAPPAASGDWLVYLGPFVPFALLAVGIIYDQRARLKEKDATIEKMADKIEEVAERVLPALTENTRVLSDLLDERRRAK